MHVLLIGATGRTGQLILADLLSRSHTVTALVRDPSALAAATGEAEQSTTNLTIVRGTPRSATDVSVAFIASGKPIDAIVVALGAPIATPFSKPTAPPRLMTEAHRHLAAAARGHGVRRMITVSAFGVGNSRGNVNWLLNLVLRKTNMAAQFEDHDCVDEEMRRIEGIDWTGVRPVMLAEGDASVVREFGDEGTGVRMMDKISRKSLAQFIVLNCLEEGRWVGKCPVIAN